MVQYDILLVVHAWVYGGAQQVLFERERNFTCQLLHAVLSLHAFC